MPEEIIEANEEMDLDAKMDAYLDAHESDESTEDTSTSETKEQGTEESEGTDLDKKSDSEETEEVPKEFHKHPAWQRILKQRDEYKGQVDELKKGEPDLKAQVEEFNKVVNSREYIEASMKSQGYTQEAIESRLKEKG